MLIRLRARHLHLLCLPLLAGLAGLWGYHVRMDGGLNDLRTQEQHRLEQATNGLEQQIDKYAYLPTILEDDKSVRDLLRHPDDAESVIEMNLFLDHLSRRAGTLAVYLLDGRGRVTATSNWTTSESFLYEDLAYRPYFTQAAAKGDGRFFGIGTTWGIPGYYLSSAIRDGGALLGVAVIKISLEQLEQSWPMAETPVLVSDENGVIILSSVPGWKYFTLKPLDEQTKADLYRSQHYNRRRLNPLPIGPVEDLDDGSRLMTLSRSQYVAQSSLLPGTSWTLTVLSPLGPRRTLAITQGIAAAGAAGLIYVLALLLRQWAAQTRDRRKARIALQQAYDALEHKVETRTADLSAANQRLQNEVAERIRAETTLRAAQDELVQAGKLAVIGQLSTGIAHELNQPLAALRTLSDNAVRFLERGDAETASGNLRRIAALVDSMGRITGQLKRFARKSSTPIAPTLIRPLIDNALFLLDGRLRKSWIAVHLDCPDPLYALCDGNRLEQVLVNLIGNAADAMDGQPDRRLDLSAYQEGQITVLIVRDHGPGIAEEALPRLFEPFFTTKSAETGLGLGLPISAGIIRDFGGHLTGENHPDGGAVFTITLTAPPSESSSS